MNYLQARQRESTKRWDYTCHNNRTGTYAIGYCRGWRENTKEELIEKFGEATGPMFFKDQERSRPFKDHYHADGHATSEEAEACYKRFQLDQHTRVSRMSNTQQKCQVCDAWTSEMVSIGAYVSFVLCPDHQRREHVEKLYSVGSSVES